MNTYSKDTTANIANIAKNRANLDTLMANGRENITPDSFTGSVFAMESVEDAMTILNGPTGCKFYHSAMVDERVPRSFSFDPLEYNENFYFGQPRIPCTYLDGYDYVYGSEEKLLEIIAEVASRKPEIIGIINTPGAALIGDDLARICQKVDYDGTFVAIENTGFSKSYSFGYQETFKEIIKSVALTNSDGSHHGISSGVCPDLQEEMARFEKSAGACPSLSSELEPEYQEPKKAVNIFGLNIYQKYALENLEAIKEILDDCNIRLNCSLVMDSKSDIEQIGDADLSIVVAEEFGLEIAKFVEDNFGVPYLVLPEGQPVGFDSTESFLKILEEHLGADISKAQEKINRARATSYLQIGRFSSLLGLPKGALFTVKGEGSLVYPMTKWLVSYLGMIPVGISVIDKEDASYVDELAVFLQSHGIKEAVIKDDISNIPAHICFADGNTVNQAVQLGETNCGMEIIMPSLGYLDILPKTLYGYKGCLWILENILNGLRFI